MDVEKPISRWKSERSWLVFHVWKNQGISNRGYKVFCQSFDGLVVKIGGLEFVVTEEIIAQAMGVIPEGEKWYKKQSINEDYNDFLLPTHKNLD